MQSSFRVIPSRHPSTITASVADQASDFGVHDTFRYGFKAISTDTAQYHPLERHLEMYNQTQTDLKHTLLRKAFGAHAPLRLKMETAILSQPKRLPFMPSSNLALDVMSGKLYDIDFEDFLNDPKMSTDEVDIHAHMELKHFSKVL